MDRMCSLHDELTGDCVSSITIDNTSNWSHNIKKLKNRFLIIAYKFYEHDITYDEYERGIGSDKIVIKMRESDYNKNINLSNQTIFQLNFTKQRDCNTIKSTFLLYSLISLINALVILAWLYFLLKHAHAIFNTQKILTALLLFKAFNDTLLLVHVNNCTSEGKINGYENIAMNVNEVLQPIFKGLVIYLLLSLALVSLVVRLG
jgi:hypothetical protein